MKNLITLVFACILFVCTASAQNPDSLWTTKFSNEVSWQSIAPDGTLIVGSHVGLAQGSRYTSIVGIDTQNGSARWKYPAVTPATGVMVVIDGISPVPNTPFIKLDCSYPAGMLVIIDPSDGHVVIDIGKEQITNLEGYDFLLESGHLWVSGIVSGERSISLFDLRDGKKVWTNSEFLKEKSKAVSKLNKFNALPAGLGGGTVDTQPVKLLGRPINHGPGAMILATRNGVFHVQLANGNIDWEAEIPDPNKGKAIKVEVDPNYAKLVNGPGENFYVIKAGFMIACRYADGKPAWSNMVKSSGPIDNIIYDPKGLILCPGSGNTKGALASGYLKLVNPRTGEEYWGDGIKFSGGAITDYLYTDKGLAVVMANSNGKNMINIVDVDAGKFVLPKPVNVDGIVQYIELTPKGLLYKSNNEVNILGLENDKPLLALPKSKGDAPILTLNSGDMFYYYSDDEGRIYQISKTEGTSKALNKAKIEFQGKEQPQYMEQRADGIAIFSEQNAMLISASGEVKYAVYKPGVSTLKSVATAVSMKEGYLLDVLSLNTGASLNATSATTPQQKNAYAKYSQAYGSYGKPAFITGLKQFDKVTSRLKASAQGNNAIFMMTKIDDRSCLVGINKDNGEITSTVKLARRDNEPMYLVDAPSSLLFYAPKGKNMIGWPTDGTSVGCFRTGGK